MLILAPTQVTFGTIPLPGVAEITIDRSATRTIEEWSDAGPYCTFSDVAEQRITLRIRQDLPQENHPHDAPENALLIPGALATLSFRTGLGDAATTYTTLATITEVTHALSHSHATLRTIYFLALSPDGAQDPITR